MSKVILSNVRLSFPSLWTTEKYNGTDTEKYGCTFLIKKDDPQAKKLQKAILDAAQEKFGKPVPKSVKLPLVDGDEKEYDGYQDHWAIKATTKKRPTVINRDKTPLVEDDDVIYPGCYVNASIDIWVMDNQYGKRVLASLNGVQFFKEGESFVSGGSALDDFEELEPASGGETDYDELDYPFGE